MFVKYSPPPLPSVYASHLAYTNRSLPTRRWLEAKAKGRFTKFRHSEHPVYISFPNTSDLKIDSPLLEFYNSSRKDDIGPVFCVLHSGCGTIARHCEAKCDYATESKLRLHGTILANRRVLIFC